VDPPGTAWHPATDRLEGTEVYGAWPSSNAQTADATFSISFSDASFTHFLFATGDEQVWLVCTKDAAVGGYYVGERPVLMSSDSSTPYSAVWLNREANTWDARPDYLFDEDPWISVTDHGPAIAAGKIVYGGDGSASTHAATILPIHNGANVWIRQAPPPPLMDWKWPTEHSVECKDYHPRIGGGQEVVDGYQRSGAANLAKACDSSSATYFLSYNEYGVNGVDYIDFIFTFEDANTWCSGYRQSGHSGWSPVRVDGELYSKSLFTKDIEIYTGGANFGPWTKVATDSHSKTNTFTDDGTTTEWTPTAPSKYLLVRTLANHGDTGVGGRLTVKYLQLKFAVTPN